MILLALLVLATAVSAQLTYRFNDYSGVLTISGNGSVISSSQVNDAINRSSSYDDENTTLKKVIINASNVTTIAVRAFSRCSALTSIVLPNSLKEIEENAFYECKALNEITLPESIENIHTYAFYNCVALKSINLPGSLQHIGEYAFWGCRVLNNISLPESLLTLEGGAFVGCSALTEITIPHQLQSIEKYTFFACSALKKIMLPNSLLQIKNGAFIDCKALLDIKLPGLLQSIEKDAFYNCNALTNITLPHTLQNIGDSAFFKCKELNQVTCLANTEPNIGNDAFASGPSNRLIYIPNAVNGFSTTNWGDKNTTISLKYNEYPTGITGNATTVHFTAQIIDQTLVIIGLKQGETYTITSINGTVIAKEISNGESSFIRLPQVGVYLVNAEGKSLKIICK